MLAKNLKDTFDTLRGEAKFLRMVVLGLIVANLFVSCVAISRDQVVTVVPPTLAEQSWVSKTKAGEEYTEAWAMYIAMLLGNVTPRTPPWSRKRSAPYLIRASIRT
ncbi:TraE/TraK family type IV conjugative transfer system protein [Azotobacter sp. CWF10]